MTLHTIIGVYDWERVAARPLVFDFSHEKIGAKLKADLYFAPLPFMGAGSERG
jgi:dihydroneopterin aldolase